jgi:mRNA interferase MazF
MAHITTKLELTLVKVQQAEIYFANLNPTKGHEQSGLRPVLILQNNHLNKHLSTIVVAPITSNLLTKGYYTTFYLPKETSKLLSDSVILLYQVRTLDKSRLQKRVSQVPKELFNKIKQQLYLVY